ncbi:ABC transporter ATP-binding protein [Cellulomonas edaphi]|uniref:ABC transporter ATP-binding protein n=1 Tax=Cellulomonas edaphi TaxID=3053468 RepID=A0ABT7S9W6_9CELL|nr:ABC transporter ATP-binding protein [Cellulomons edaphi]MDM7832412.1 ABC transporter ATP-binding protein [Cellulomons edaphi]
MTTEPAIRTRALRKTYRSFTLREVVAVEGLDLDVPVGGVHAFLGPNGAGKTTTIRMLLGLVRPDSGSIRVLGHDFPDGLERAVAGVGAIVEQPRFFPAFSGRRNLLLLARGIGGSERAVDALLDQVGLGARGGDAVRKYALGMRQRLAIAATLLKDPRLLIFDEPTNGLDPEGIHDVRRTMRDLADQGRTVLVSSHALGEVEQVADTASIVVRGRLVASGPVAELVGASAASSVRVRVSQPAVAVGLLSAQGWGVRQDGDVLVVDGAPDPSVVSQVLAAGGVHPSELALVRPDLESVFLQLTGSDRGAVVAP